MLFKFFSDVSYQLVLDASTCNSSDSHCKRSEDNFIEYAMRTNSSSDAPWIPLQLTSYDSTDEISGISSDKNPIINIRGYNVTFYLRKDKIVTESVYICGGLLHDVQEIQFRWMATSYSGMCTWALANVTANFVSKSIQKILFQDTFSSDTLK